MQKNGRHAMVLGAGPAGISAAHRLLNEGYKVTLVERRNQVGGLGGSFSWNDFVLDYGPHAFHPRPSVVMDNIKQLFKDDPETLIHQNRNERIQLYDKIWNYPMRFWELALRMPPWRTFRMGMAFLLTNLIYRYIAIPDNNFEAWCIKRFGKPLYRLAFGNYTEKVWGIPARKINYKFAAQKIRGLNLKDLAKKILGKKGQETIDYWDDLFYPKMGSGQLYERYCDFLRKEGVEILLDSSPSAMTVEYDRITSVTLETPEGQKILKPDTVVSTIPLTKLTDLLHKQLPHFVQYTATRLKFRALVLCFVEFAEENITHRHWIYMLDRKYTSNRYTEQKNMSEHTCPKERTTLCYERSCDFQDAVWNMSDDELYKDILDKDIKPNPRLRAKNITGKFLVKRVRHAYPVYDLDFDTNLRIVLDGLARVNNLYSTGRQGLFLQNGMHQSMLMGWDVCDFATKDTAQPWDWYLTILKKWDMD